MAAPLEPKAPSEYTLKDLIADDKFSTYENIKKNFNRVEGGDQTESGAAKTAETVDQAPATTEASMSDKPKFKAADETTAETAAAPKAEVDDNGFSEDDDAMNYFASLANDDA